MRKELRETIETHSQDTRSPHRYLNPAHPVNEAKMLTLPRENSRLVLGHGVLNFSIDLILPAALWPRFRLSLLTEMSTRNLPGGKGWRGGA
jgi:hypothetical protein